MEFDWDPAKHQRNVRERGFGFNLASLIFDGDTIELPDTRQNYGEVRMQAIGRVDGLVLVVVYTDRPSGRRIISARLANRRERERWDAR